MYVVYQQLLVLDTRQVARRAEAEAEAGKH